MPNRTNGSNRPVTTNRNTGISNRNTGMGRTANTATSGRAIGGTGTRPSAGGHANIPRRAPAGKTVALRTGGSASIRPNGKLRSIDRGGTHIQYNARGGRTVSTVHNGAHVVTTGSHRGYVQRPYVVRNGRTYVQRTYVVNHVTYSAAYRSYYYRGGYYYAYAPAYYYHPVFYGWAYNPWPAPVYWSWGWTPVAYPWYGYYGYYFAPYPAYPSAAYWLTDYLIAANLQAAYAAHSDEGPADDNTAANDQPSQPNDSQASGNQQTVALSPEVKEAIAQEVKAQLSAEQAATGNSNNGAQAAGVGNDTPPALDPALRTFVVSSALEVSGTDQDCTLTPGDVVTRITDVPDEDQKVTVAVTSSKKADCAAGQQVLVAVQDLQEMHNHFREQLDAGLKELAAKQGKDGLPPAPDVTTIAGEIPPPAVDATAAKSLQDQESAADQTEKDVSRETSGS